MEIKLKRSKQSKVRGHPHISTVQTEPVGHLNVACFTGAHIVSQIVVHLITGPGVDLASRRCILYGGSEREREEKEEEVSVIQWLKAVDLQDFKSEYAVVPLKLSFVVCTIAAQSKLVRSPTQRASLQFVL